MIRWKHALLLVVVPVTVSLLEGLIHEDLRTKKGVGFILGFI